MLAGLVGMRGPAAWDDLAAGLAGLDLVRWACAGAACWAGQTALAAGLVRWAGWRAGGLPDF